MAYIGSVRFWLVSPENRPVFHLQKGAGEDAK
jgi:hypothetical protein